MNDMQRDAAQRAALQQAQTLTVDDYHAMTKTHRSKYGNKRIAIDGYTFDSLAEGRRYDELKLMQAAGLITGLMVHPRLQITDAGTDAFSGKRIKARYYEADFMYTEDGHTVYEDVKGTHTQAFRLKWDIVRLRYPAYEFRLVQA